MLCHRHQRYVAEDLSAAAFGDLRGEALDALRPAGVAPASPPPATAAAVEVPPATVAEVGPAAPPPAAIVTEAPPVIVAEVGPATPVAIEIEDSPPSLPPRAEGQERPVETAEERRTGKTPRLEAPPGPSAKETLPPPPLIPWFQTSRAYWQGY